MSSFDAVSLYPLDAPLDDEIDVDDSAIWEPLKADSRYEICRVYPYQIRKRSDKRIVSESETSNGYVRCHINNKKYLKHRLVALQWISNPDGYKCVDHINHIRTDNHIDNLRWTSQMRNTNNRIDQLFVNEIPDDAIVVDDYNDHKFEDLYFHDDVFYKYNGINYAIKPKYLNKAGNYEIKICDITGKFRNINYPKFKRQYGLI